MNGRRLSHYQIVEEISRGGMGVVYRALDVALGREVALKVLPDDLAHDSERRARLLQEARAASALEHPHVAVIHEVGEAEGVTFVAMELIRGEKLSDTIARGSLTVPRALALATEIAEGLARAHERGIIHRDLKPSNVMVTEDGHAKVIDFGLAKVIEPEPASEGSTRSIAAPLTRDGAVLGTAAYMSPEQARASRVDHRSDIFALGVTLYEMLSGRAAFQRRSSLDTLQAVLGDPVPDLQPSRETTTEVTAEVQRIIRKATAKDPDDRYQGMKDLVVDLRAVRRRLESSEDLSRTITTVSVGPARLSRGLLLVAALAGVLIISLATAAFWRSQPDPSPPEASGRSGIAVMYFENNTGDASLDWMRTGLANMLVTNLSQSSEFEVVGTDRVVQILQDLGREGDKVISADVIQTVAERARVENVLVGSYVRAGGVIRISARLQDAATGRIVTAERVEGQGESSVFQLIDDLTQRFRTRLTALAGPAPSLAFSPPAAESDRGLDRGLTAVTTASIDAYRHYSEGLDLHERSLFTQAAPHFQQAIEADPDFAMAYAKLAVVMHNIGRQNERDDYARRALERLDRLTTRERYYIEGFYYGLRPDTRGRSIEAYKKGLELHPEHQASRHNLGVHYLELEFLPEGIREYEELIRRGTSNANSYENLVDLHLTAGNVPRAREVLHDYWKFWPDRPIGYRMRGMIGIVTGDYEGARAAYERAGQLDPVDRAPFFGRIVTSLLLERWEEAPRFREEALQSGNPFTTAIGVVTAAGAEIARGRMGAAVEQFEQAAAVPGLPPGPRAGLKNRLAVTLLRQNRIADARDLLERALADARGRNPEIETLSLLAVAHAAEGRTADADRTVAELEKLSHVLPTRRDTRRVHWTKGEILRRRGDPRAALPELRKAVDLLSANAPALGPPQPHLDFILSAALAHRDAGESDEAIRLLEQLQTRHERAFNPDAWVRTFYLLGDLYEQRGDHERARQQYRRFVDLWGEGELERGWVARARMKSSR